MNVTVARQAILAFLTQPAPGTIYLNLRVEGEDFYRLEISEGQLANIVVDGARMALRSMPIPATQLKSA
jgi:hypothetical protein